MESGDFRLVPYRFFVNESDVAMCKLKKLANLFPDMKEIIELELFKSNNLSHIIDRLSGIYPQLSALDVHDDTFHIFLGPYHLCLGPAIYAALRFKNVSAALMAAASSKRNPGEVTSRQSRRREIVLRRFRRTVRKLILIRSILDQIRLGSVLTPFNQHELTSNGIYDLVLAGHQINGQCKLPEAFVTEELNLLRTSNQPEQKSFLLASNFIKVNTLLYLMSPSRTTDSVAPSAPGNEPISNPNDPKGMMDASAMCCSQHTQRTSLVMLPMKPPPPPQASQVMSTGSRSRLSSTHNLRQGTSFLSRQNTVSDPMSIKGRMIGFLPLEQTSSHSESTPVLEEDALINQISSLLTNYLNDHGTLHPHRVDDSMFSSSINNHKDPSGSSNLSLASISPLSMATGNEFDRLLHRVKTRVGRTLSTKVSNSHPPRPSLAKSLRQQRFSVRTSSYHETSLTDYDTQRLTAFRTKRRLDSFSKSQSLDETNSEHLPSPESDFA